MRIGVDLDEILADYLSALIEFHNKKYHTALKKSDFFPIDFGKRGVEIEKKLSKKFMIFIKLQSLKIFSQSLALSKLSRN